VSETEEGKVRLAPTPGNTGDTVYIEYTYPRWTAATITSISEEYLEGLRYHAASLVLSYLYIKRGRVRSGRTFTGGGGTNERELSKDYLAEAEREIPKASAIFCVG
jgi:hypothetical protein